MKAAAADSTAIWPAFWVRSYADYRMAPGRLSEAIEAADEELVWAQMAPAGAIKPAPRPLIAPMLAV